MGIWTNIDKFDGNKSTFKNWVAGIAKYKSLNYVRKYLRDLEHANIDELEIVEKDQTHQKLIENELDEELTKMLGCLKEEDQDLFIRLYVKEQEMDYVSQEIGVKKDVIYNRVSRGKKRIRDLFKTAEGRR